MRTFALPKCSKESDSLDRTSRRLQERLLSGTIIGCSKPSTWCRRLITFSIESRRICLIVAPEPARGKARMKMKVIKANSCRRLSHKLKSGPFLASTWLRRLAHS